ncbi:MAG TPA: ABC transporter permease [Terriglobales bacterium]|nr:ABC transporter permease [Terriglobales bacterium]
MRLFYKIPLRLRSLLRRTDSEQDLRDEMQFHLQSQIDEFVAQGMTADEARCAALRALGGMEQVKEECRDMRNLNFIEFLLQDLRFGFRTLRRSPGFSILAVLCLTLGIGANAAVFSWIEGILLRPFPAVAHQERLVAVAGTKDVGDKQPTDSGLTGLSWPDLVDLRRNCTLFDFFIADPIMGTTLSIGNRAERATGSVVSANYFDALGITPILGRGFGAEDDSGRNAHPVVVISYWIWKQRFHGDPEIVGKTQLLNGVPHTIIGVAPENFYGTFVGWPIQFWVPVSMQETFIGGNYKLEDRSSLWIESFARLKPGVTIEQAQAEISAVAKRLENDHLDTNRGRGVKLFPLWRTPFNQAGNMYPILRIAMAVVFFVLLIACANVANLLLVRSFARRNEMTVRLAIGAARGRILRQLLTEGLILSGFAALGGIVLAYCCRNLLVLFFPSSGSLVAHLQGQLDWRVLLLSIGTCMLSTLLFGLFPAIQTSKLDLSAALKSDSGTVFGGRAKSRIRSSLVLIQVALSFILLVGAVLLLKSMQQLRAADPGFSTQNMLVMGFDLVSAGYDKARARIFQDALLERVQAIPGVQSAALARITPFSYAPYSSAPIAVEGYQPAPSELPAAEYNQVSPRYFETLGIPIISGREFTLADNENSPPVVIVNQKMVAQYWHGEDPIGRRLQVNGKWMRVIGVAKLANYEKFGEAPKPFFYTSIRQDLSRNGSLNVRTSLNARALQEAVARVAHELDANVAPSAVYPLRRYIEMTALSGQQVAVALLSIFGGLALLLAAVGLYAVMSYAVSQSTRELGLRMALGASPADVLRLILSHGFTLTAAGLVLGAVSAFALTRLMGKLLFTTSPHDPVAFLAGFVVMMLVALPACVVPACRASRTDPLRALRES